MSNYEQIIQRMIESAGHTTQSLGIGRVMGQIFAYLYFSKDPRSLNDLTRDLGISKGSASIGVRQLEQWGALQKVWIKGDRKDYYSARSNFGKIIRNAILDLAGKRMTSSASLLDEVEEEFKTMKDNEEQSEDAVFIKERIEEIRAFQNRAQKLWNGVILNMLLKK